MDEGSIATTQGEVASRRWLTRVCLVLLTLTVTVSTLVVGSVWFFRYQNGLAAVYRLQGKHGRVDWASWGPLQYVEVVNVSGLENVTDVDFRGCEYSGLETLSAVKSGIGNETCLRLRQSSRLRKVILRECPNLTEAGVRSLAQIPTLGSLSVSGVGLHRETLAILTQRTSLEELWVSACEVDDILAAELGKCRNLTTLDVSQNPISDEGVKQILAAPKLEWLMLSYTEASVDCLPYLANAKSLRRVDLVGLGLTREDLEHLVHERRDLEIHFGFLETVNGVTESKTSGQ